MSLKRSKAMILNHIFHLFTVIGMATMTSKGSVSHILLVYNLLRHFTVKESRYRHHNTSQLIRNCIADAGC